MQENIIALLLLIITTLLGVVSYFVKNIFDKTAKLEEDIKPIAPAIVEIQSKFTQAGHTLLFPLTVAPGSPLHVTEYGDRLLRESGFYKVLQQNHDKLVQMVKEKNPKTKYDIQQYSIQVITELLAEDHDMANGLKEYVFEHGLDISLLIPPAGIALRDEVMKDLTF